MLALKNVALRRGKELLFDQASLIIHRGFKVGLTGANGSGKTSLFKLILAEIEPDQGAVELPPGTRIAHLAQEVPALAQAAIDYVLAGDAAYTRITAAIERSESNGEFEQLAGLHEQLDAINGYSARSRGEQLLAGLGFPNEDMTRPVAYFSGGWRIRLNLARTLMQPADLLLLDEPTNHLDLDAIIWLADWIKQFPGTLLLISHDRELLDECVDHVACLHLQSIELFSGNYSAFEKIKAARLAEQQSLYVKQQREIAHMREFIRRFRAKESKARQAQSRIKALERMELIAAAHIDSPFRFAIHASRKMSTPLLSLRDAVLGYGEPVLRDVNLSIQPGDRFGLLGVNGAVKSTLIKTLTGALPLLGGARVEGSNLLTGYFSQHQLDELQLEASAVEHIEALHQRLGTASDTSEQDIRNFLGGFNFRGDKLLMPVRLLSGGEKARLALALVTRARPNLLLMDEPTNHLDINMRQALTLALQSFSGALLLVSHDRHLMTSLVDQFLLLEDGRLSRFDGDLADYRARKQALAGGNKPGLARRREKPPAVNPAKQIRRLATRLKTLETRIARLERKLAEVETRLARPELYQEDASPGLQTDIREHTQLRTLLEELEQEWLEVASRSELAKNRATKASQGFYKKS